MSITDKLVSIIVPVYNTEKYLDECISSIVNQSYSNLEIILVDDGSTDSSSEICDGWASADSRITAIHQENGGLSRARNVGIDKAHGEYICFIDSDDYVTREFVWDLINALQSTEADFVFCDMDSKKLVNASALYSVSKTLTGDACRDILCDNRTREYVLMVVTCNKMFHRSLFESVRFLVGKYHEDEFMINNFLYRISHVAFIPKRNYIYRVNESGITGKNNINDVHHLDVIDAYVDRVQMAINNNDFAFATQTFKLGLLKLVSFYKNGDVVIKRAVIDKYKDIYFEYEYLFDKKKKVKYGLFRIFPKLFCRIFV